MIGDRLALRNLVSLIDDWDQGQNRQADQRSKNLQFKDDAEIGCVAGIEHCTEAITDAAVDHDAWNNPKKRTDDEGASTDL